MKASLCMVGAVLAVLAVGCAHESPVASLPPNISPSSPIVGTWLWQADDQNVGHGFDTYNADGTGLRGFYINDKPSWIIQFTWTETNGVITEVDHGNTVDAKDDQNLKLNPVTQPAFSYTITNGWLYEHILEPNGKTIDSPGESRVN